MREGLKAVPTGEGGDKTSRNGTVKGALCWRGSEPTASQKKDEVGICTQMIKRPWGDKRWGGGECQLSMTSSKSGIGANHGVTQGSGGGSFRTHFHSIDKERSTRIGVYDPPEKSDGAYRKRFKTLSTKRST